MRQLILIAVALLPELALAGSPTGGRVQSKAPWLWTDEERLAARFDAAAQTARVEAFMTTRGEAPAAGRVKSTAVFQPSNRPADIILGRDHPELLMPFEIFGIFVRAAYGREDDVAQSVRRDAQEKATALGLPTDFLATLERESIELIRVERDYGDADSAYSRRKPTTVGETAARQKSFEARACPLRTQAIKQLRSIYGVRFYQFLYSAIAPGVFRQLDAPQTEGELRTRAEGCP
jgi:hypothetical protein